MIFFVFLAYAALAIELETFTPQIKTKQITMSEQIGTGRSYSVILDEIQEPYKIISNHTIGLEISETLFEISNSFELQIINEKPNYLFTDFHYFSKLNRALILRNDLTLIELELNFQDSKSGFKFYDDNLSIKQNELNLATKYFSGSDINDHPSIIVDNENVIILCDRGSILFKYQGDINTADIKFKPLFNMRQQVITANLDLDNELLFILYVDTIDIYNYDKTAIEHLQTLTKISPLDICFARDAVTKKQYFHILDRNQGVLTYSMEMRNFVMVDLIIPLPNSIALDSLGNTLMVITQTKSQDQILAEFFINYEKLSFYVNKFEFLNIECFDLKMVKDYTLVVGYNAHKIVMHGIHKQFRSDFGQFAFYQHSMFKAITDQISSDKFMIYGMAQQQLKVLEIKWNPPALSFQLSNDATESYQLEAHTKKCKGEGEAQGSLEEIYGQCRNIIKLNVSSEEIFYESKSIMPVMLFLIGIVIIIVGGLGLCFWKYRQWRNQNLELQQKFNSLNEVGEKKVDEDEKGLKINELQ